MATTPGPIPAGPFTTGMNNRLPDTDLQAGLLRGQGKRLRSAVNVDITSAGTLARREGYALSLAATSAHSLWSDGESVYVVDDNNLYFLSGAPEALTKNLVRAGLTPGTHLSFESTPLGTVYSDGTVTEFVSGTATKPLSVPAPSTWPSVTTTGCSPGDGLVPGVYRMCITLRDAEGRESPASGITEVTIPRYIPPTDDGNKNTDPYSVSAARLLLTGIPTVLPPGATGVVVYCTPVNGTEFYAVREVTGVSSVALLNQSDTIGTRECPTLLLEPIPSGSILKWRDGRFWVAKGNSVYYSEPYSTLYDPAKNYITYPDAVTMIEGLSSRLYVGTTASTYVIEGDITEASNQILFPYGVVPGTSGLSPDRERAYWTSARGLVAVDSAGQAKNLQEENVATNPAREGAAIFREVDGRKQVVTSLFGADTTGASAYSYMAAEVIRKGNPL